MRVKYFLIGKFPLFVVDAHFPGDAGDFWPPPPCGVRRGRGGMGRRQGHLLLRILHRESQAQDAGGQGKVKKASYIVQHF